MRRILDLILSWQRGRWFLRLAGAGFLLIGAVFLWLAMDTLPFIEAKQQELRELNNLEDSVATLQLEAGDSILAYREAQAKKGVFSHWDSAAKWLENMRVSALRGNVEMGWEFDSLVTFSEGGQEVFRLPVRIYATASDRNFETFMRWLELNLGRTDKRVGIHQLEFMGEDYGLHAVRLHLEGFLRP